MIWQWKLQPERMENKIMESKLMQNFMTWLSDVFAPKARKVFANPWIDTVASTMKKVLPIILTGSVIFFYNVFRSYIPALPDLSVLLTFLSVC